MAETYWELVETSAREHPRRVVLADDFGRSLTCAELRDAASRTAAAFFEQGVTDGTVVTWQLPTTLETMVVMVALRAWVLSRIRCYPFGGKAKCAS